MKHPNQILKIIGILLLLALFFLSATLTVEAASQITLTGMEKQESISYTRLTFYFSDLPNFKAEHSGQKVDLLLSDVQVSAKLQNLPEDETVVKILLAQKHLDLLTSILLRRAPVQVITESMHDPARVVMDLFWVKGSSARPGIAFRIADMPARKQGKKKQKISGESPWQGHWREFFRDYRTLWKFSPPLSYTLPPLPALITDQQSPLWPLQKLAADQKWLSLQRDAATIDNLEERTRYQRDLLVAEAQVRSDAFEAGLALLQALRDEHGTEQLRVDFLTAYAQARTGQPYVAQLTVQGVLSALPTDHPLIVPIYLLAAETALESKQNQLALSYLQNPDLVWPNRLQIIRNLRIADARAGLGEREQSLAEYRDLTEEPGLFENYLFSCNRAAFSAFQQGEYSLATHLYRTLVEQFNERSNNDLPLFAVGTATYEAGDLEWALIDLQKATLEYPNTEGGDRAALRLIDHKLLSDGEIGMAQAIVEYERLGNKSISLAVREEARFKQALAQYLLGDQQESVENLVRFRREFSSSYLRREADLLLLEQIPPVVERLIEQKNELQAVVLVEQNRNLLLRGGFSRDFLNDLSGAFERLGLYDRASRVLLYMFDRSENEIQRLPIYLPLAKSYLKRGEYNKASEYASRYLEKYPQGKDSGALFGILFDAFAAEKRNDELLTWLDRMDRPTSPALEIRAAWLYWEQQKLANVVKSLDRVQQEIGKLEVKEMALLAEAYYQLKRNSEARKAYQLLQDDPRFGTQARYRSAQLLLRDRQPAAALNLLAQLVEEDDNDPWRKLAQDLLIQAK